MIATDQATDGRPFDGAHPAIHKLNLDTNLLAADFQETVRPLSTAYLRAMVAPIPLPPLALLVDAR